MKLKIKDMDIATGGPLVAVLNNADAKLFDMHEGDRISIKNLMDGEKTAIAIIDIAESEKAVPCGSVGCYEEVLSKLSAKQGSFVQISLEEKPKSIQYIRKKLNGQRLSYKEFYEIVNDIAKNKLSDVELAYFVSACHTNIMTMQETIDLTKAMINTGEILDLKKRSKKKPTIIIDKHCVGGVAGNRTTMIVVPILAAAGLTVPKTSSRSIT